MIKVAIIIANWNGKKYLKDCFDSLAGQTDQNFEIIFVDNGSEDGSVDFVEDNYSKKTFPGRLEIMKLEKNTGFARGYNKGIERALQHENIIHIIVLNNDTKLEARCIESLVDCMEKHPEAGSIQALVLNFFEKNTIDCAGIVLAGDGTAQNRGYGEKKKTQYEKFEEIFGANGTVSLFSRSALEKTRIGRGEFFDNSFFAYYEDTDLAWRMRLSGFRSYFCPQAVVFHLHSATAGKFSLFKAYYLHRNYFFTVFKNYPFDIMIGVLLRRFLSYIQLVFNIFEKGKKEAGYAKEYGKGKVALAIIKAWASVIVSLPEIWRKRRMVRKQRKVSSAEIKLWLKKYTAQ
jgi:GT2 family glycosyltransferase